MGRERVAGRPKGPMSAYACFVQVIREEHKKKHPEEQINFAEFSKKCAEKWKTMTPKEKKRFEDMSVRDKERHEREMAQYNAVQQAPSSQRGDGGGGAVAPGRRRKRKMLKDKDAPKRALYAQLLKLTTLHHIFFETFVLICLKGPLFSGFVRNTAPMYEPNIPNGASARWPKSYPNAGSPVRIRSYTKARHRQTSRATTRR